MGIFDKTRKDQDAYIAGLQNAITMAVEHFEVIVSPIMSAPLPDAIKDVFVFAKEVYIPLCVARQYVYNYKANRLNLDMINNISLTELPDLNDLYEQLRKLPLDISQTLIVNSTCSNLTKKELARAIENNNRELFINTIQSIGSEADLIIKGAKYFQIQEVFHELTGVEGSEAYVDGFIDVASELAEQMGEKANIFSPYVPLMKKIKEGDIGAFVEAVFKSYIDQLLPYFEEYDNLSSKEREIIDHYVKQPKYIDLYNECKSAYDVIAISQEEENAVQVTFNELVIFDGRFTTPNKKEFFSGIDPIIVKDGDDKFKQMVNYIANSGYIENTDRAKTLFTYRLTGKCRPEGELEKLVWDGRDNLSPNELLYIIRYSTDNSKDKYNLKSASNLNGNLNCSKELEHYAS